MQLIHYTERRMGKLRSFSQGPRNDEERMTGRMKPRGLWLSVRGEFDWAKWCHAEQFALHQFRHGMRIILKPGANVLHLKTGEEMDAFAEKYGYHPSFPVKAPMKGYNVGDLYVMHSLYVDWARVAEDHQGIIISPYHWSCRMAENMFWYYGWDCASACIWDHSVIAQRIPLTRDEMAKLRPRWRRPERWRRVSKAIRLANERRFGRLLTMSGRRVRR